ncbi:ABC transporter ATP-binding protein [Motiliproteus sp. MSK22-1]|uniref:ABC transporter ATP-binding protein n=1 Tax=Motiliproteus sp. MSK22-1 TaxID=1897630 RepID=UPI000976A5A6|nr:ABC transporter ATP-binding protein [Motiliproteus sp. MSK22-1]OMH36198.1 ABC transporter permease [Motiliproteus sp. MSK22-1]
MTKSQFVLHYLLLNKYSYLFAVVCIFSVNWLQVEIPRYIQIAIDLLNQTTVEAQGRLVESVQVVILFSVVMVFIRILSRMYALNPGRITEAQLKNDLFYKLNRLPSSFHEKYPSGKLISIINNDLNGIRLFYGIGFLQLFNIVFSLSLTPIWMWDISPGLTLYSVIPIIVSFVFFRLGFKRLRALHADRMKRLQDLSEQLMNYLSGIDLIKNQQMDSWVAREVEQVNERLFDCTMKITRIQTFVMPILDYANHFMKVLILGLGGYYLLQQQLTIGEITAFLSYSVLLALPLMHLGRIVTVFQMGMVSIDSVQAILGAEIPEADLAHLDESTKKSLKRADLVVKNLSYSYPVGDDNQAVLKNISFTVSAGQKLGVLGSVGSGKSTLVNCLNHYLDVEPGHIFWGGVDITQLSRQDWRTYIRTITQEPYLFSDTITENVQFGAVKSSAARRAGDIRHVLKLSALSDDIDRFGDGEQTVVGERGIMLSGGQKQRLSIARALLTPCDLIIMDNVLSAVDYETERKILKGVFNRVTDQSLLVVSHRISALEMMDQILVLEHGKIIATGTHKELLQSSTYYRETWELQQHESENAA